MKEIKTSEIVEKVDPTSVVVVECCSIEREEVFKVEKRKRVAVRQ